MSVVRFLGLLLAFIGVLASCVVVVMLLLLMLRFWPVLLVGVMAIALFGWLMEHSGIHVSTRD
ncbi:hypothetical protein [Pseudomonas sp. Q1-7]|uniref:hypothetical protein n=1 Tax=Pseudomonas sp. Q1-7 TaxID=3020843 RepID=UPI0023006884|nr:hypothetical protein [Pseudomonas sp. Q1-7]